MMEDKKITDKDLEKSLNDKARVDPNTIKRFAEIVMEEKIETEYDDWVYFEDCEILFSGG